MTATEAAPSDGRLRAGLRALGAALMARETSRTRPTAERVARAGLLIWAPVLVALGIGGWFLLRFEPRLPHYGLALAGMLAALGLAWLAPRAVIAGRLDWDRADLLRLGGLGVALGLAGFLAAGLRLHLVAAPVMDYRYYGPVEGRVVEIDRSARDRMRVTLDRVTLRDTTPARTPRRVRLSLTGDIPLPQVGSRVMLTGHLGPPPGPAEPFGFDFRRSAFFEGLGAVGYTRTPILTVEPAPPRRLDATAVRLALSAAMQREIGGQEGAVASALMTGDRSGIAESTNQLMRDSNLYHIVSISGLHMSMLAGFVYAALRLALAGVQALGLLVGRPVHKLAALAALVVATVYLWLSGGGVPTERAWLMVAVMLAAVLADRRAISLRTVALAALMILLVAPEALVTPGFQMSFAATAALILLFPAWSRRAQMLPWVLRGAALLVISSLIAALATSPLAAAYFNRSAQYGMVANLLVVPVMGAVVMPAGVFAALLAPVGLAGPALWLMGLGTRWMLHVAELVTGWGGAVVMVTAPHWAAVPLGGTGVTVALLALHGARGRLSRVIAALAGLMVLSGALLWLWTERPDILIAGDGTAVGLMTPAGRVLSKPAGAFIADSWLRADGDLATAEEAAARPGWQGEKGARQASLGEFRIVHLSGKGAADRVAQACTKGAIVILAARAPEGAARDCLLLDQSRVARSGAMAGWLREGQMRWVSDEAAAGARLWTSPAVRRAWGLNGTRRSSGEGAGAAEERPGAVGAKGKGGPAEPKGGGAETKEKEAEGEQP
ncbi:ComEC/Rec2 family competence protein [Paracoccus niistensis]|uniref:ComEC/Rec2 family competence protein n=1 Tax=Paracoccus niistensis TaxID=632935 RepID=A0ABV6I7X5_9RHOB